MGKLIQSQFFPQISLDCGNYDFLENPSNITLFVISSLLHVMDNKLPIKSVPQTTIAFSEKSDHPICYRDAGLIILTANPNAWDQLSYQLAHEMCHRIIPNEVVQNLRWLEESICELSSYYFLPQLSKHWRRKKYNLVYKKTNKPYYSAFEKYVENDKQKVVPLELSSFASDSPSDESQLLVANCEIREKNAYIATSLLPIFNMHPNTWRSVPLLASLKSNASLESSLEEWIALSPEESRIGLQKIAQIFGAKISQ